MNKPQTVKKLEKEITVEEFLNFVYKHMDCITEFRNANFRFLNDDPSIHIKLKRTSGKIGEKISPTIIISLMHGKMEVAQSLFAYENNFKVIYREFEGEFGGQIYEQFLFDIMDVPKSEPEGHLICEFMMSHAMDDHKETEVSSIK